jgi:hypothetical protein
VNTSEARGAMLLLFDVAEAMHVEHDDWHTHEHMPERLGLPGFLRGSRWVSRTAGQRYCVLYEVADLGVLDSAAYRARLEAPTPWATKMMGFYRGMRRTLCERGAASGSALGGTALVMTFAANGGRADRLQPWLVDELLPRLSLRPGLCSARLLRNALPAAMTREQSIRGRDASVESALFVTGDDEDQVAALCGAELAPQRFEHNGATVTASGVYRLAYVLAASEVAPRS